MLLMMKTDVLLYGKLQEVYKHRTELSAVLIDIVFIQNALSRIEVITVQEKMKLFLHGHN